MENFEEPLGDERRRLPKQESGGAERVFHLKE